MNFSFPGFNTGKRIMRSPKTKILFFIFLIIAVCWLRNVWKHLGNNEKQLGNNELQLGNNELQLGNNEKQLVLHEEQLESHEEQSGSDEEQSGSDEEQSGSDEEHLGSDEELWPIFMDYGWCGTDLVNGDLVVAGDWEGEGV